MKNFRPGKYIEQGSYRSFIPEEINREWQFDNMEVINLLSKADRQLGRLDMYSEYIPNIELFISMHVLKEATKSSKIEGTKTNIEEALQDKEDIAEEKRDDWEEVQNYIEAMDVAISSLDKLPFSSRLIKKIHKAIIKGVRGENKMSGEFRLCQNWIGGASVFDAIFIPPPHTELGRLMEDLENFAHNESIRLPVLLKAALIHYQFVTIHPFLEGNGRVGRILINSYLAEQCILMHPVLYLSDFFERYRQLYYQNLMKVREDGDIAQWFKFFLVGVIETAKNSISTLDKLMKLKKGVDEKLQTLGRRTENAETVLEYLYRQHIVDAQKVQDLTGLTAPPSYELIAKLEELNIIKEFTGAKRGKKFIFEDYLELFS